MYVCVCLRFSTPSTGCNESEDISLADLPSPAAHACFCVRLCVMGSVNMCEMFV